ncbi:hypothetical protein ACOMHN_004260 [Nucella lapillus]
MKHGVKTLADLSNDVIPIKPHNDVKDTLIIHSHISNKNNHLTTRKTRANIPTPTATLQPTTLLLPDINPDVSTKTRNDVSRDVTPRKNPADSSRLPMEGEKPHDLLQRLYEMWPAQLSQSYLPSARANPEATVEFNFRFLRKLHPPVVSKAEPNLQRVKAAGVVVETVFHLGKKMHLNFNLKR